MDFYAIPPNAHLEMMNEGDRFFCLAQQYIKDSNYREFFKNKVFQGSWVTLDNGAGDHDLITEDVLLSVVRDLRPCEVIPPDVLFDGISTIRNLESFIHRMIEAELIYYIDIFGCPQGRNFNEWLFVYEYMLKHPKVSTIGLSKIAVPKAVFNVTGDKLIKEARWYMYDHLKSNDLIQKPIHLLGMGDPTEMPYYKNDPLIRSTDSCNSIWSAMNKFDWKEGNFTRIKTPQDYFDRTLSEDEEALAYKNIFWFQDLLKTA